MIDPRYSVLDRLTNLVDEPHPGVRTDAHAGRVSDGQEELAGGRSLAAVPPHAARCRACVHLVNSLLFFAQTKEERQAKAR